MHWNSRLYGGKYGRAGRLTMCNMAVESGREKWYNGTNKAVFRIFKGQKRIKI
jgi:homoaconitase/3-isopropylmalate dehydratase large subunit